jgi:hypothetical protein
LHLLHLFGAFHQTQQSGLLDTLSLLAGGRDLRAILDHLQHGLVLFRSHRKSWQSHFQKVDCLPYLRHGVSRRTGVASTGSGSTGRADGRRRHW